MSEQRGILYFGGNNSAKYENMASPADFPSQRRCMNNKDKGNACDKPQSTRWYFNEKKFRCMAFTYLGCGGNDNNFVNMNDCHTQCMPADGPACLSSEFALPAPMPKDATKYGSHWCQKTGCPTGFQCHNGIWFSQCCNQTVENWFTEGSDPKCKNGRNAYQLDGHLAVGDTCSDLVCPQGHTCESTNLLFAKCCP
uniref:BPTI/Kunitz inhibitor domain-containing protein n=1 Tax=Romanomermis culicivorax TaxID=13658 RepID=A0A915J4I9_ROMCU